MEGGGREGATEGANDNVPVTLLRLPVVSLCHSAMSNCLTTCPRCSAVAMGSMQTGCVQESAAVTSTTPRTRQSWTAVHQVARRGPWAKGKQAQHWQASKDWAGRQAGTTHVESRGGSACSTALDLCMGMSGSLMPKPSWAGAWQPLAESHPPRRLGDPTRAQVHASAPTAPV